MTIELRDGEVLNEDDIMSRVAYSSEERRNFEECPENFVTHENQAMVTHLSALRQYLIN